MLENAPSPEPVSVATPSRGEPGERTFLPSETPASDGRLRVGVFADSPLQPRWIVEALARVADSDFALVVAVAERRSTPPALPWLWRVYSRLDHRVFGSAPDPSEGVALKDRVAHLQFMSLPEHDAADTVIAAWRARIMALDLDVAFAAGNVADSLLDGVAKYGVWRYCFGEECASLEVAAGFREAAGGAPVTASALRVCRGGETDDRLVYRSWSRTYPLSVARNRSNFLHKSAQFAGRALRQLHRSPSEWLQQWESLPRAPASPAPGMPGTGETVRAVAQLAGRQAQRGLQKLLYVDQWFLAYRFGPQERWQGDLRDYTCLVPPTDRIWADPFPIERNGRHFIFFEEVILASGKGHIAVVEVDRKGVCSPPVRVLERDYHLSYPSLIEHEGQLFMVPETGDNRTVELYRCIEFPGRWRLEKVLLRDAWFTDATLHRDGDKWWMFVNIGLEGAEAHDELHLYFADDLMGEWRPHRGNPVKSDARCARPAGRPYLRDGVLYRPAQICAPLYGSGISINRVLHVSPQAYVEREEERILPPGPADQGLLGIHTVNRAGDLSVVDVFMRRRRLGARGPRAISLAACRTRCSDRLLNAKPPADLQQCGGERTCFCDY